MAAVIGKDEEYSRYIKKGENSQGNVLASPSPLEHGGTLTEGERECVGE